jgi:hypothetical protein
MLRPALTSIATGLIAILLANPLGAEDAPLPFPELTTAQREYEALLAGLPRLDTTDESLQSYYLRARIPTAAEVAEAHIGWQRGVGSSLLVLTGEQRVPTIWAIPGSLMIYDATRSRITLVQGARIRTRIECDSMQFICQLCFSTDGGTGKSVEHEIRIASIFPTTQDEWSLDQTCDEIRLEFPSPSGKTRTYAVFQGDPPTLQSLECLRNGPPPETGFAIDELQVNQPLPACLREVKTDELRAAGLEVDIVDDVGPWSIYRFSTDITRSQIAHCAFADPALRSAPYLKLLLTGTDWDEAIACDAEISPVLRALPALADVYATEAAKSDAGPETR